MTQGDDSQRAPSRRRFLKRAVGAMGGLLAASCAPEAPAPPPAPKATTAAPPPAPAAKEAAAAAGALPDGLDVSLFHLHTQQPLTLEAKRSSIGLGVLTPMSRFFVRNNLPMPPQSVLDDRDGWSLQVEGVKAPRALTLAQLKQLGVETVATVLQCSGNGRQYYTHGPSGSQWGTGAAGCAMWTGVPVRKVVEALGGVADGMSYMTSTGGDPLPDGVDPLKVIVERSIPVAKGLGDALLAWEMNGAPLPLTHGGPLRLIVPGFYGCNQIKYIKKLAFTAEQTQAKIQRSGYRLRPIGEKGDPSQPSMWQMNLKSWVSGPGADAQPVLTGPVLFHGVAFSGGERAVERVEVSLDGGATWADAAWVGPDLGPWAWRNFTFAATLAPGEHTVVSRAWDASGASQPEQRVENERGYGNNSWRDLALTIQVVKELPRVVKKAADATGAADAPVGPAPGSAKLSEQGARGRQLFTKDASPPCASCHTLGDAGAEGVVGPNLDQLAPDHAKVTQAVTNGVGSMPPYRETLSSDQIADIARYIGEATGKK